MLYKDFDAIMNESEQSIDQRKILKLFQKHSRVLKVPYKVFDIMKYVPVAVFIKGKGICTLNDLEKCDAITKLWFGDMRKVQNVLRIKQYNTPRLQMLALVLRDLGLPKDAVHQGFIDLPNYNGKSGVVIIKQDDNGFNTLKFASFYR